MKIVLYHVGQEARLEGPHLVCLDSLALSHNLHCLLKIVKLIICSSCVCEYEKTLVIIAYPKVLKSAVF